MKASSLLAITVVFFVVAATLQSAWAARLAKPGSPHPSFPLDAFAKPSFQLFFDEASPISNATALELLRLQRRDGVSLRASQMEVSTRHIGGNEQPMEDALAPAAQVYLHRSSPTSLHLCSVPPSREDSSSSSNLNLNESSLKAHRTRIVENALRLLAPLKEICLFHTLDWFTYSLCYGEAIKQFRALPGTTNGLTTPTMDPKEDSYVLGRWSDSIEAVNEGDASISDGGSTGYGDGQGKGTELMELVHFSSLESSSSRDVDAGRPMAEGQIKTQANMAGRGRYISQFWTDGTRCIINNEMRTTEVQYHCSQSSPGDRISMIKEVTTCSYVVVIDTPRLCEEPALAQVEDEVRQIRCQPILGDDELERRARAASAQSQIDDPARAGPANPHGLTDEQSGYPSDSMRDEEVNKSPDVWTASLQRIVDQLNKAAVDASLDLVEIVVGMDDAGKVFIEPRTESKQAEENGDSEQGSADGEQTADSAPEKIEQWNELVKKLLNLNGELLTPTQMEQLIAQKNDYDRAAKEVVADPTEGAKDGVDAAANGATSTRNNHMVREKESFAQKVDRFYKKQEAQLKLQEAEAGDNEEGAPAAAGSSHPRDEL